MTADVIDMGRGRKALPLPARQSGDTPETNDDKLLTLEVEYLAIEAWIDAGNDRDEGTEATERACDLRREAAEMPAHTPEGMAVKARLLLYSAYNGQSGWDADAAETLLADLERASADLPDLSQYDAAAISFEPALQSDRVNTGLLSAKRWHDILVNLRCAAVLLTKDDTEAERLVREAPEGFQEVRDIIAPTKQGLVDAIAVLDAAAARLAVVFARIGQEVENMPGLPRPMDGGAT